MKGIQVCTNKASFSSRKGDSDDFFLLTNVMVNHSWLCAIFLLVGTTSQVNDMAHWPLVYSLTIVSSFITGYKKKSTYIILSFVLYLYEPESHLLMAKWLWPNEFREDVIRSTVYLNCSSPFGKRFGFYLNKQIFPFRKNVLIKIDQVVLQKKII